MLFGEQRATHNTHNFKYISVQFHLMFDYSNKTICNYGGVNLNSDSILRCTPERLHSEMLLYPFEEKFNLPSVFVKECYIGCFEKEIVSIKYKRTLQLRNVGCNPSNNTRIVRVIPLSGKSDRLVEDDIAVVSHIPTFLNLIFWLPLFSDNKERANGIYCMQSSQSQ